MEQLKLTIKHLLKIGFIKNTYYYEIPCLNGYFCYNQNESIYKWYQKIVIGNGANHIHLNIESLPELFTILSCFCVNYNMVERI
uniref:Uncharacterized protein n=1 Tax=viral metagenome TaxID=1070528 RepID=A0A6H2A5W1_9ZZZZ